MIKIKKSLTADTRSCDYKNVSKEQLYDSSVQHINDVELGLQFFRKLLIKAAIFHDHDKLSNIDQFHDDFLTGFRQTSWWDNHRSVNCHHLLTHDGVPEDVNLIDVIEMITDCVMAGKARSGKVYDLTIPPAVLRKAFDNTVKLLTDEVVVE